MEDELKKRNTDCVYFLASPLTCKKGMECEFRHNEIARLNPRDCWYWLAGNCLNPTCAFRHPPLETQLEKSSDPASLPPQASVPGSKSSVPCYFYFNGFCNKGENCPFLHGPNTVTSGQFSKAVSNPQVLETKTVASNEGMAASTEPLDNQLDTKSKYKVEVQPSASTNIMQQFPSPQNSLPECEEAIVENLGSPLGVDQSPPCADQSSGDQFDGHIEPDERWESSPGFDVLVDDGSENLVYEDDAEYLLAHKGDNMVLHELLHYDYEDPAGYDPLKYPESGVVYQHVMYGSYDNPEDDHISDHVSREMMVHEKRQLLPREAVFKDGNGTDLRNHLRKRRRITGRSKRSSSRGQERSGRRHSRRPLERNDVIGENNIPRYSRSRSRQEERERRRQDRPKFIFSEISRGNTDARITPESSSTAFTRPKTLAEIKEEKRRASRLRSTTRMQNFEGPKPLSEILKDKRRPGSMSDDNSSSKSRHDHSYNGFGIDNGDLLDGYEE